MLLLLFQGSGNRRRSGGSCFGSCGHPLLFLRPVLPRWTMDSNGEKEEGQGCVMKYSNTTSSFRTL